MEKLFLTEDDDLSPKLKDCLCTIFKRFDKDKDGAWSTAELDDFATFMKGYPFTDSEKTDIKDNFEVNEKGELLEAGFLQLYLLQTLSEPAETVDDMKRLGYNETLNFVGVQEGKNKRKSSDEGPDPKEDKKKH